MLFIYNFNIFNIDAEKPFSGTLNKVYVCMYVCTDARGRFLSMRERVARSDKEVLLQSFESSRHIIKHCQQKFVILSVLLRIHLPFIRPDLSCNQIKLQ